MKKTMTASLSRLLAGLFLGLLITTAFAADQVPTIHQVYQAAESGNMGTAQAMMREVLRAHPNSGKAHFVESELLARQGQVAAARSELREAQHLEPGLPFAKPEAVRHLEAMLNGGGGARPVATSAIGTKQILFGAAAIAVVFLLIRNLTSRRAAPVYPVGSPGAYVGPGAAGPYIGGSGLGGSVLGGLATGAAMGAGMVAGEALVNRMLDNPSPAAGAQNLPMADDNAAPFDDMGGSDFGVADNSSWDDGQDMANDVDVGGDDWS